MQIKKRVARAGWFIRTTTHGEGERRLSKDHRPEPRRGPESSGQLSETQVRQMTRGLGGRKENTLKPLMIKLGRKEEKDWHDSLKGKQN